MKQGTAQSFAVFVRTWWRRNPSYPCGLEPCPGRKRYLGRRLTEEEARTLARQYNATHDPGRLSKKAEYERE
ncbi:MAG: hypothetical protein KJ604_20690 [Gammaproteobacteria bacterium]|nr:hypothetical protein [Gammaproteobacteria bacterium]